MASVLEQFQIGQKVRITESGSACYIVLASDEQVLTGFLLVLLDAEGVTA